MADDSLIEEMRAAVRGDRERARQRQLAARTPGTAAVVTDPEPAPEAVAEPPAVAVEPTAAPVPEPLGVEPGPESEPEPLAVEPEPVPEPAAADPELPPAEPPAKRRWWSFRGRSRD